LVPDMLERQTRALKLGW